MKDKIQTGMILDERIELSLTELSHACASSSDWIIELVQEGIIEADGPDPGQWRFSGSSLLRVHSAIRLQKDLELNLSGVALALDLLDEIAALRARVARLESGE